MPDGLPNVIVARPAPKAWWRSRTLLLNMAVLALAGAEAQLGLVQPLLPVNVFALVAFALPIINGLMRLVTTTGVALRSAPAPPATDSTAGGPTP